MARKLQAYHGGIVGLLPDHRNKASLIFLLVERVVPSVLQGKPAISVKYNKVKCNKTRCVCS